MEEILQNRIIDLGPVELVIVPQLDSASDIIKLKVYEREHFFPNPNPVINQSQIAEYSVYPNKLSDAVTEIKDLYGGWSKIDKSYLTKVIGIHNQNPRILYIQFSHGERYFIYKRCLSANREMVFEELFGRQHGLNRRPLSSEDEQYLIAKLRFMPKTKNAISFYSFKPQKRTRRHFSFSHPS